MGEHLQIFIAIVGVVAALISAWSIIILTVSRMVLRKCVASLEGKINGLGDISKETKRLEISILQMKADLPLSYVRREDFIRFDTVINVKLDRLRDLVEEIREKKDE